MAYYCPNCWTEVPEAQCVCPQCNKEVVSWNEKRLEDKLLQSISDPDLLVEDRAVYLLGENMSSRALEPLIELFGRRTSNNFFKTEIVKAVGKIGGESACSFLIEALREPWFIVRAEAVKALRQFSRRDVVKRVLKTSLKDANSYVREVAKEVIDSLGSNNRLNAADREGTNRGQSRRTESAETARWG